MWSFGYTDWYHGGNGAIDVYWGESSTFDGAVSELYDNVQKMANDAEEYEMSYYEQVLADIMDIKDDSPEEPEDMEFTDNIGGIIFYVVQT